MKVSTAATAREILESRESSLGSIMRVIDEIDRETLDAPEIRIGLSSNVTVELLGVFLRRYALLQGKRAKIIYGNYDDPLTDMDSFLSEGVEIAVMLPFFDNLMPSFEAQIGHTQSEIIEDKLAETVHKYHLAFGKAERLPHLFFCTFCRFSLAMAEISREIDRNIARFNEALLGEVALHSNVHILDMSDIVACIGKQNAFDHRFYYKAKAPFSTKVMDEVARRVSTLTRGFGRHFCKALILDCDGTLWGGVLGEDLLSGIKLGAHDYPGNVFWRIQHELVEMERNGVLLCLCSKNNPTDVDDALREHPGVVIKESNLVLKKVNWNDKVANIKALSGELNIGLDSLVFLDDSPFECESVRTQLPMVRTFQVPANLSEYPSVLETIKELFIPTGITEESRSKTMQYRMRASAENARVDCGSNEEYLSSLGLKLYISKNDTANVPRISELSMKSNQFNLTTFRYSEAEIRALMKDPSYTVFSFSVKDKFGDSGLVGVVIVHWEGVALVELFLMSCRVLGRGIEFAVWDQVRLEAEARGVADIEGSYIRTAKNAQVSDLYARLGLSAFGSEIEGKQIFRSPVKTLPVSNFSWIEVHNVG